MENYPSEICGLLNKNAMCVGLKITNHIAAVVIIMLASPLGIFLG